jgi:F0F1-type ATP synthase delta subunit
VKASRQQIARAVVNLIDAGHDAGRIVAAMASYLTAERRASELTPIMRQVERLRLERGGVREVVVVGARPISRDTERQIRRLFADTQVNVVKRTDKNLVGGLRVTTLDERLDLSVRGRLRGLVAQFAQRKRDHG